MSIKDELRAEIMQTPEAYHNLLAEIPDEAFSRPSNNPAWTIDEVLFHISLTPRFMIADLRVITGRPWLAKVFVTFVPAALFHRLNEFFTRHWSRNLDRTFLAEQYDSAHKRAVERLYRYIKLHFEVHAAQIQERLHGILV
jgi:hypothetical protein